MTSSECGNINTGYSLLVTRYWLLVMKIALIGRPNVGKSSLFNRLIEKRTALQTDIPGTTRDRHRGVCYWKGKMLEVIDTPGLKNYELRITNYELGDDGKLLEYNIQLQAQHALKEADIILYIIDGKTGPIGEDYEIIKKLRREKKKIARLAVNKTDTANEANDAMRYQNLGLGEPLPVSAKNGLGTDDLLDTLIAYEHKKENAKKDENNASSEIKKTLSLIIIGKPNVGKSSLFNAVLKEERVVVSPIPHTTRDPNDTEIAYLGYTISLVDTAGLRKKARVYDSDEIEIFSVKKTLEQLKRADIALLMIDCSEGIGTQDRKIAGLIEREKNGLIMAANKWDAVLEKTPGSMAATRKRVYGAFRAFNWAPVVFTSVRDPLRGNVYGVEKRYIGDGGVKSKNNPLHSLLDLAIAIQENRMRQIGIDELRASWKRAVKKQPPPRYRGYASSKILEVKQIGVNPPRFSVAIPKNTYLPAHYLGYLENELRKEFGFWGTGIVLTAVDKE